MNLHEIIRKPLVTEKSNIDREEENVVTLAVDPRAFPVPSHSSR